MSRTAPVLPCASLQRVLSFVKVGRSRTHGAMATAGMLICSCHNMCGLSGHIEECIGTHPRRNEGRTWDNVLVGSRAWYNCDVKTLTVTEFARLGGKARAQKLSKQQLSDIGKKGGRPRLDKKADSTPNSACGDNLLAGFLSHETMTADEMAVPQIGAGQSQDRIRSAEWGNPPSY